MKSVSVDVDSWVAWCVACGDRETDRIFKEQEWARTRHEQCRAQARSMIVDAEGGCNDRHCHILCMSSTTLDNAKAINDTISKLPMTNRAKSMASDEVVVLPILNWASLAAYSETQKRVQSELFGMLVNQDAVNGSIGLAVMPVVGNARTHGQVWRFMMKAHEMLFAVNVNPDRYFMLQYNKKADERSERPLLFKVVTATPLSTNLARSALSIWKCATCMSSHITDVAKMVKTSDMVWPTACDDSNLPDTTEADHTIHAEKTYAQLGVDAADKILDMAINADTMDRFKESRKHVVVVDLTLGSSLDFARATLAKLPCTNLSYVGFADSEDVRQFTEEFLQQEVTEHIKSGVKCIPSFTPPSATMPSSMAIGLPPKPSLNVLTFSDKKATVGGMQIETLHLPDQYMKLYHDHPTYGAEFRAWFAKLQATLHLTNDGGLVPRPDPEHPRPPVVDETASKRAKTDVSATVMPNDALPDTFIHETAIPKTKAILLVAPGYTFYIKNPSEREIKLEAGVAVAEFFKGKWANARSDEKESVQFSLTSSDNFVKVGAALKTVEQFVSAKKNVNFDEAKVRYHDAQAFPLAHNPRHFKLVSNQVVFFVLEPLPMQTNEKGSFTADFSHIGSAIPVEVWSKVFRITWYCKWTIRGLSPLRPVVVLRDSLILPPHSASKMETSE